MLLQVRVNLLLYLSNFVDVFDTYTACYVLSRFIAALLQTSSLFNEPRGGRWFHDKFKATVDIGLQYDAHRNLAVVLSSPVIEFLAELHHIDTKWTKCLTDLWRRLGNASVHIETHGGLVSGTRIHFSFVYIIRLIL